MIRLLPTLLVFITLILSSQAQAAAGWTGQVRVIELIPSGRHYYEIHLAVDDNPSGCREKNWFYQNYDAAGADKMFELFVDSLKSQLRLRVYVTGVCNFNGYSEISAVSARSN